MIIIDIRVDSHLTLLKIVVGHVTMETQVTFPKSKIPKIFRLFRVTHQLVDKALAVIGIQL